MAGDRVWRETAGQALTWRPDDSPASSRQAVRPQGPASWLDRVLPANLKDTVRPEMSFQAGVSAGGARKQDGVSVPINSWCCVLKFLGGLLATILLDIIYISIFYPRVAISDTGRFSVGMAILSLLLKPFSCYLVHHMYRERGGELPFHSGEARSFPLLGPTPSPLLLPAAGGRRHGQVYGVGAVHRTAAVLWLSSPV